MKTAVKFYMLLLMGFFWSYSCTSEYNTEPESPVITLPVVKTSPAFDITSSEATVGIIISSNGHSIISEKGVVFNTTQNPTITDNKVKFSAGITWTVPLTGLTPGTTYYVRAYAINSMGIAYGSEETFTCSPPNTLATVFTSAAEYWDYSLFYLGGKVIAHGSTKVTEFGFVYSTTPNPTLSDTIVKITAEFYPKSQNFGEYIFDVEFGNTYYVRAYAINGAGIAYGNEASFIAK